MVKGLRHFLMEKNGGKKCEDAVNWNKMTSDNEPKTYSNTERMTTDKNMYELYTCNSIK